MEQSPATLEVGAAANPVEQQSRPAIAQHDAAAETSGLAGRAGKQCNGAAVCPASIEQQPQQPVMTDAVSALQQAAAAMGAPPASGMLPPSAATPYMLPLPLPLLTMVPALTAQGALAATAAAAASHGAVGSALGGAAPAPGSAVTLPVGESVAAGSAAALSELLPLFRPQAAVPQALLAALPHPQAQAAAALHAAGLLQFPGVTADQCTQAVAAAPADQHAQAVAAAPADQHAQAVAAAPAATADQHAQAVAAAPADQHAQAVAAAPAAMADQHAQAVAAAPADQHAQAVAAAPAAPAAAEVQPLMSAGEAPAAVPTPAEPSRPARLFWKSNDYEPQPGARGELASARSSGLDHARLHPKFLHSNATSHKWALGAVAELLDNSMDEAPTGATYVHIDKLDHPVEGASSPMLLVEDDGGGMDPDRIRNCMSFGYSVKRGHSKMIGQYGNGFKTSTMRLGGDALVFTKCAAADSWSIGLLSYTFLRETRCQDVVVPIVDYHSDGSRMTRGSEADWAASLETIVSWSPYKDEEALMWQLKLMGSQGTQVYIFNLWETEEGGPELDFDTDPHDIRLRSTDECSASEGKDAGFQRCMAYRYSLRAYASILYQQWPDNFHIRLRGRDVQLEPIRSMMKYVEREEYRPRGVKDAAEKGAKSVKEGGEKGAKSTKEGGEKGAPCVEVAVGFAREAPATAIQGFCVYHRNRLIKPFWKVYNSPSSVGRGVIGFLSADFVEPAHDKQDFERTHVLQKLEAFLKRLVPQYWNGHAHLVGYQKVSRAGRSGGHRANPGAAGQAGGHAMGLRDGTGGENGAVDDTAAPAAAAPAREDVSAAFRQMAAYVPMEVERIIGDYVAAAVPAPEQADKGRALAGHVRELVNTAVELCGSRCREHEAALARSDALEAQVAQLSASLDVVTGGGGQVEVLEETVARLQGELGRMRGQLRVVLGQMYRVGMVPATPPPWLRQVMAAANVTMQPGSAAGGSGSAVVAAGAALPCDDRPAKAVAVAAEDALRGAVLAPKREATEGAPGAVLALEALPAASREVIAASREVPAASREVIAASREVIAASREVPAASREVIAASREVQPEGAAARGGSAQPQLQEAQLAEDESGVAPQPASAPTVSLVPAPAALAGVPDLPVPSIPAPSTAVLLAGPMQTGGGAASAAAREASVPGTAAAAAPAAPAAAAVAAAAPALEGAAIAPAQQRQQGSSKRKISAGLAGVGLSLLSGGMGMAKRQAVSSAGVPAAADTGNGVAAVAAPQPPPQDAGIGTATK